MNFKIFIFLINLIFESSICYSQNWIFRIKPLVGSPILSFQKFNSVILDNQIIYSNGNKPANFLFSDNAKIQPAFNLELYAEIYQINKKILIGSGFGFYNGGRVFLKVASLQNNSIYTAENQIIMGNGNYFGSSTIGFNDFNFYLLGSYDPDIKINSNSQNRSLLSMGFGVTNNKKNDRSWITPIGVFEFETFKRHSLLPFLLFRYELELVNKNGKNIFNCYLNYQQGIFNFAKLTLTDVYDLGPFSSQVATSRGTSIGIGLTKPINCSRNKK